MRSIAIVGASVAGVAAARALRQLGFDGQLSIIGDEAHLPYDRPPLSKEFLAGTMAESQLSLQLADEDLGADWRLGVAATGLEAGSRTLHLSDGTELRPDGIVLATGARPRELAGVGGRPGGAALRGVHQLRTLDDARSLRAELVAGARLVVVGAGLIGAEVASSARALGLEVTVVEALPTPLAGPLGADLGRVVSSLHAANGVRLLCGVVVEGLTGSSRVTGVRLAGGAVLDADVVVIGVGVTPNVEWLAGSGLAIDDGVRCSAYGGTDAPGIVAAGDCASWLDAASGARRRFEHWTNAREGAATAAAWLLSGGTDARPARAPYFWSDQYGTSVRFAGSIEGHDEVTVEEGTLEGAPFLALYRRRGEPIGVVSVGHDRAFTRWRRELSTTKEQSR